MAAACLGVAARAKDPTDKAELIEMARIYHKLADDELWDDRTLLIIPPKPETVVQQRQQPQQRSPKSKDRSN